MSEAQRMLMNGEGTVQLQAFPNRERMKKR